MDALTVKDLTVQYRYGAVAVSDLSFCLNRGVTCILGVEESGKTTLLKTLAGLQKPTNGKIYFDEKDADTLPIKDRNVCLLYEDGGFFERKSARKNLFYALKVRNVPKEEWEGRISFAVKKAGFDPEKLDTPVKKLSKVDRLYLAFARALFRKADLYLLDDAIKTVEDREEVFEKIAPIVSEWAKESVVLYATDRISECAYFDGNILFLNYGVCVRRGKINEIKTDPMDLVTVETFFPGLPREETTIEKEKDRIFVSAFGKILPLDREKLLSDVFIGKTVVAVLIGDKIELFDAKSERKIYFY